MDYIEAGGRKRPFKISYKAIKELKAEEKNNPEILTDEMAYSEVQMFIGFKHGALKDREKVDFELSDMEDWIDEDLSILDQATELISKNFPDGEGKKKGG